MKRSACVVCLSLFALMSVGASTAVAQAAAEPKYAAQISVGPTLGHKSSGFVSGELDWRLNEKIDVFGEVGHMVNVATSNVDANASLIANALGAQVGSTGITVNHFDVGVRFRITPPRPNIHPYVIVGIGAAHATTETTFTVNGEVVDPAALGAFLGGDLSGSNWKTILVFGGGLVFPFSTRYFVDVGYRFGGILSKVSDIENDITIKTQRLMIGAGVRF